MVVDIIVLAVLLISALISFIRGFIRETLTILGVVGGLAAAYFGGPILSPFMKDWLGVVEGEAPKRLLGIIPYDILGDILSYGLIFIVIVIVLSIVSHILAETVRAIGLGAIDRTLGFIFGLARGALLLAVLYLPVYVGVEEETKKQWFEGSKTQVWMEALSAQLAELLPDETVKKIEDSTKAAAEVSEDEGALTVKPLDMLKQNDAPATTEEPQKGEGYNNDFRNDMDKMFKDPATPPQPTPPSTEGVPQ